MKEKLIIKNFGPIKSVELDLGRFNILIGEQATGKSTVAKVLAVCRYFSYIVEDEPSAFEQGLEDWGLKEYINPNSFISYKCDHYLLTVQFRPKTTPQWDTINEEPFEEEYSVFFANVFPISNKFKNLLLEFEKIKGSNKDDWDKLNGIIARGIPTSFFLNDVKNVIDNPFYLTTERGLQSIFSIGQGSIRNLSDSLFNQFSRMDGIARQFKKDTFIEPLNIYYQNRDGYGYIRKVNETQYYSLFNAASGYQSTIPVVLLIKYYSEIRKKTKTFLIEEPELNLFPSAQNRLMQYLVDKTMNLGNSLLFTTQSPYTLTSVNNMMYAYQVGQKNQNKVSDILDKKYWLNPDDVSVYRLMSDGTAKNIVDEELKQINAGELDEISRNINENWDKIADVEFSNHES